MQATYPVLSPITPIKPFNPASGAEQQRSKFLRRIRISATADLSATWECNAAMYSICTINRRMPINNPLTDLLSLSRPLISDGGCCQSGTRVCSGDLALSAPTKCGWLSWTLIGKIRRNLKFYRDVNWIKRVKTTHRPTRVNTTSHRTTHTQKPLYIPVSRPWIHMRAIAKHQDGAAQHPFRDCIPEYCGLDSFETWI